MIKLLDDELYPIVCSWWKAAGMEPFPRDMLPRHSYVVSTDKPVIAGFLYKEETAKFGLLGWIISNPESSRTERRECLNTVLDLLYQKAKEEGLRAIFTFMKHDFLVEKLKQDGFTELSNDSIQLIKIL